MKRILVFLCFIGFIVPYFFLVQFVLANGPDLGLFIRGMFADPVAAALSADIILSSITLWVFLFHEHRKRPMRYWWVIIPANILVGLSLAFPLFLLLRTTARENRGYNRRR